MENSSAASASSEAGSSRSQEIEELERFIDSYVLEYQVQGLLTDKADGDGEAEKSLPPLSQVSLHGALEVTSLEVTLVPMWKYEPSHPVELWDLDRRLQLCSRTPPCSTHPSS